jgi:hypothetical protein
LDKARRTNHNKAACLVRVRNKAEDSSVDLAKTTNKINSSKVEVYSAGWANKIKHNKLGVYLVVRIRTSSSSSSRRRLEACSADRHRVLLGKLLSSNFLSWHKVTMQCGSLLVLSILVSILGFGSSIY